MTMSIEDDPSRDSLCCPVLPCVALRCPALVFFWIKARLSNLNLNILGHHFQDLHHQFTYIVQFFDHGKKKI